MRTPNPNTIGLLIEAATEKLALKSAYQRMDIIAGHYHGFTSIDTEAGKVDSPWGQAALDLLWRFQAQSYKDDYLRVAAFLASDTPLGELLESLDFRSSCYALGRPDGWPVRLYDPYSVGVLWQSSFTQLAKGMPNDNGIPTLDLDRLWLVLVQIDPN